MMCSTVADFLDLFQNPIAESADETVVFLTSRVSRLVERFFPGHPAPKISLGSRSLSEVGKAVMRYQPTTCAPSLAC
jgi:hypothetical protein